MQTLSSYPPRLARFFPQHIQHRPQDQRDLPIFSPSQAWPLDFRFLFFLHPIPQNLPLCLLPAATSTLTAYPDVQVMMKDWQDAFFKTMQDRIQFLMGDAPPQPTEGSSILQRNMDPNKLQQLSPSGDREASWAQHKSGKKRADGCSRSRSPAGYRSEASKDSRSRVRDSSASSSPPSQRLRADSRSPVCHSCSQDNHW